MLNELSGDELRDLVVKQLLFLGILGFGVAAGTHIGVGHIQAACIEAGALPQPGASVSPQQLYKGTQCWQSAKFLSNLTNGAGALGGVFLLGGAVLDQHPGKVNSALGTLTGTEASE